ncbi:MAG: hypothetical protein KDJ27_19605 [Gammaproteobacteria bacterium]|nr:hypothetical protein [Gammaproteobacteria bacterium]
MANVVSGVAAGAAGIFSLPSLTVASDTVAEDFTTIAGSTDVSASADFVDCAAGGCATASTAFLVSGANLATVGGGLGTATGVLRDGVLSTDGAGVLGTFAARAGAERTGAGLGGAGLAGAGFTGAGFAGAAVRSTDCGAGARLEITGPGLTTGGAGAGAWTAGGCGTLGVRSAGSAGGTDAVFCGVD